MKLVDKQVVSELIGPFIFGAMAFSSVFFAGSYLLKITNWLMNGLPLLTAGEIVLVTLPQIVVYTLPMATVLAVLMGVGRMSGDSEVVALFAGGISLYRIAVPIIGLGVVVSALAIVLNEVAAPRAYLKYEEIQAAILKQTAPTDQPFTVRDEGTNSRIDVNGGMDVDTGVLKNVTVTQFANNQPFIVIYARQAVWTGLNDESNKYRWRLYDGWWQLVGTNSPATSTFGQSHTKEIQIQKTPDQFSLYQMSNLRHTDQLSFAELTRLIRYIKANPDRPREKLLELEVDRWNKLSLPLSSLVFAMLATPMGIRPHRSTSSVGFGLSILVIFIYWMVWHYTSSLAVQGNIAPIVGAFLADVLGIAAAIALMRRAAK